MNRNLLLVLLILSMSLSFLKTINAQKINFNYVRSIKLDILTEDNIIYYRDNNNFYYCSRNLEIKNDSIFIKLHKLDLEKGKETVSVIYFPYSESLTQWSINALAINSRNIAMICDSLYLFNSTNELLTVHDSYHCRHMYWVGDEELLLAKNYNSHPLSDSIKSKIILINTKKRAAVKYERPKFKYFIYTHFVGNHIDFLADKVAFSQTLPYHITIYNAKNLNIINAIQSNKLTNPDSSIVKIDALHRASEKEHGAKKYYYELKKVDSTISRIEKIHFLDKNTLLVSKRFPYSGFEKRLIDIWKYKNNAWAKIVENQLYQTERPNDDFVITPESLPLDLTFSDKLLFDNKYIYVVNTKAPPPMNINNNDLDRYYDGFYEKNDLNYYLWIYRWEIK